MKFNKFVINEETKQLERWNDYVNSVPVLASAVKVLKFITKQGYDAYIVGGAVRDLIIGDNFHDIDIATNMPLDELEKSYKTHDIGKSKDFGIVTITVDGNQFEVANFRSDGVYTDGRRPDTVKIVLNFKDDASRRDFTINSMGIDKDGNIIDYFDGTKDIKNKIIKTVGNPKDRFQEDYLRMMRVARFSARLGFEVEPKTKQAIKDLSHKVSKLAPERIRDEIMKAASQTGDKFAQYIIELDEMGILQILLPEIVKQKGYTHSVEHHPEGGVWEHTLAALRVNDVKDPIINLAILLHDVGKPSVMTVREHGGMAYFGHAEAGIKLANDIADRLKFSNKEREAIIFSVANHMKFHEILGMKASKIAKLVADDNWDCLVAVAKADNYSRGKNFKYYDDYDAIVQKAVEIKEKWGQKTMQTIVKLVDGNHVMELTGLKPSKKVGDIIRKTTDWIIDNNIKDPISIDRFIMRQMEEI